ncbi:MAG: hypothetical protein Q4E13_01235 [Clostridia bacterium]|nr:hypothetical protein [Clostridia bacterium]
MSAIRSPSVRSSPPFGRDWAASPAWGGWLILLVRQSDVFLKKEIAISSGFSSDQTENPIWSADMAEKTPKVHFREFRNIPRLEK